MVPRNVFDQSQDRSYGVQTLANTLYWSAWPAVLTTQNRCVLVE
jgi:hypothetical protein